MPSIYALGDPRTNEIRYVGMAKDVYKRYAQHLNYPEDNEVKNGWIEEIKNAGILPTLIILESGVSQGSLFERETYWIHYHLAQGAPLANIVIFAPSPSEETDSPTKEEPPKKLTHVELRVKEIAQAKGFSQSRLGRLANIDVKSIRRIFTKPTEPVTTTLLSRLANALEVNASELITSVED